MKLEKRAVFGWGPTAAGRAACRNGLVIHYDGSDQGLAGKPHSACRSYWKSTRSFHMGPSRGWADLGYSYGCCAHGIVMEGRGFGRVQAAQPGGNSTWTSVTLMTGPSENPTAAQINAVRELRAWLRGQGLGAAVRGHRDFVSTSCPGDRLYRLVKDGTFTGSPSGGSGGSSTDWMEAIVKKLPALGRGDKGEHVESLQGLLMARSHKEVRITGTFDAVTEAAVKAVQKWGGVAADGIVGPKTWPVLLRVHN